MFGGSEFSMLERILLLGKALGAIFQKYALKTINIWKIIEKIGEKVQIFPENFLIFLLAFLIMGNIRNRIWTGYNGGSGGRATRRVKNLQEIGNVKLKN